MVWENNSRLILMMCETTENKTSKCANYWPKISSQNLSEFTFINGLSIRISTENQIDNNLTERNFLLSDTQSNEKREITQLPTTEIASRDRFQNLPKF